MDALISGRGYGALLINGSQLQWLDARGVTHAIERQEVSALLHNRGDFFEAASIDRKEVDRQLRLARETDEALLIFEDLLNGGTPPHFRQRAATELNQRLADRDVVEQLERVLWAHELKNVNFNDALETCRLVNGGRAQSLINRLRDAQETIHTVCRAWNEIASQAFAASAVGPVDFHYFAVRDGLFRELVEHISAGKPPEEAVDALEKKTPQVRKLSAAVLAEWVTLAIPRMTSDEETRVVRDKIAQQRRGSMRGIVLKARAAKTVNVRVDRWFEDPKYGKRILRSKKFLCHCENNTAREGDTVIIVPCRPRSRRKHHEVVMVIPVGAHPPGAASREARHRGWLTASAPGRVTPLLPPRERA